MAYALTAGAVSEDAADHSFVAFVYDHEECGSASDRGAQSGFFEALLERLCGRLGYSREDLFRTMARSVIFSADMAHAAHPSYCLLYTSRRRPSHMRTIEYVRSVFPRFCVSRSWLSYEKSASHYSWSNEQKTPAVMRFIIFDPNAITRRKRFFVCFLIFVIL